MQLKDQDVVTFGGPRLVKGKDNPFIFKFVASPEMPQEEAKQEESKGENTSDRKRKW